MSADQYPHRTTVTPVPEGTPRPLWSVMIPTYNCAAYLRQTLASVLAQAPGPEVMQIEVIDDHSTKDDPETVVKNIAGDRVTFYRQPNNVGHVKNFHTCLKRARGQLVHLLHGDDYVLDGFYRTLEHAFENYPEIGAAFCRHAFVDELGHTQGVSELLQEQSGVLAHWLERIVVKQYIQTPSIAVRREVYERIGAFDQRFKFYYEDWEMWVRIATRYPVWYDVETRAAYRVHSIANSAHSMRTGENLRDIRRGLDIVESYLPDYLPHNIVNTLLHQNREYSALYALHTADRMLAMGDIQAGISQIREALKCSHTLKVIKQANSLVLRAAIQRAQEIFGIRLLRHQ